jgi:hypothetical protein
MHSLYSYIYARPSDGLGANKVAAKGQKIDPGQSGEFLSRVILRAEKLQA